MMTAERKPKYQWLHKLSFEDRKAIVRYYLQGYGLWHIAAVYGVSTTAVEYHLKKANVFTPNKKPTLFGNVNPIQRPKPFINRTLTVVRPQDTNEYYFDSYGEKYRRPLTYQQIVRKQSEIARMKARLAMLRSTQEQQEDKPKGFLIRVSLQSGDAIIRNNNGEYERLQSQSQPSLVCSTNNHSW